MMSKKDSKLYDKNKRLVKKLALTLAETAQEAMFNIQMEVYGNYESPNGDDTEDLAKWFLKELDKLNGND